MEAKAMSEVRISETTNFQTSRRNKRQKNI
ncbi:unnamed protein product [Larinioides sclopetarius]|uniref:Uncharacterized protein n=1 Tax=Larinioides sclopetarius TaxID=280406 RepID=A0AAV2AVM8_9ARAC